MPWPDDPCRRGVATGSARIAARAGARASAGRSDEVLAHGDGGRLRARRCSELGDDAAHVRLDGREADDQPLGDLEVGEAVDHESQHVPLTSREPGARLDGGGDGVDERVGGLRRERARAGVRPADRLGELLAAHVLEEAAERAGAQHALDELGVGEARERQDLGLGAGTEDLRRRLGAVHASGQYEVHQDDVRARLGAQPDRRSPGVGLADQVDVAEEAQDGLESAADQLVVVDDHDSDGGRLRAAVTHGPAPPPGASRR